MPVLVPTPTPLTAAASLTRTVVVQVPGRVIVAGVLARSLIVQAVHP